jgi:hypothetical protein
MESLSAPSAASFRTATPFPRAILAIVLNFWWLNFAAIFLVPKFQKLAEDGVIDLDYLAEQGFSWMPALLEAVHFCAAEYAGWFLLAAAVLVGLFEWRMRSHNKTLIRLLIFGTVVFLLSVVSVLVGVALAIPQLQSGPVTSRMAVTFAKVQIEHLDASIGAMEQALLKEDWEALKAPAATASQALYNLDKARPAVRGLWSRESPSVEEMRSLVAQANAAMTDIRQAIINNNAAEMELGLRKLRQAYAPLREAAKSAR